MSRGIKLFNSREADSVDCSPTQMLGRSGWGRSSIHRFGLYSSFPDEKLIVTWVTWWWTGDLGPHKEQWLPFSLWILSWSCVKAALQSNAFTHLCSNSPSRRQAQFGKSAHSLSIAWLWICMKQLSQKYRIMCFGRGKLDFKHWCIVLLENYNGFA